MRQIFKSFFRDAVVTEYLLCHLISSTLVTLVSVEKRVVSRLKIVFLLVYRFTVLILTSFKCKAVFLSEVFYSLYE